ncbi:isochorismate synthase [Psychromicrobium lacuslunae]|uniref:isochorismate synthase n=1 Tax=Psychromicrobium lacuslunae TaxID=1618207 RepID=A0A0D4C0I3_9MICC|nr:isochorismate synthase [Psychromicrobium lacuslunae]AJT41876.1 isochorismate synthase [Psychromicrobium lacuslunae]
MTSTLGLVLRSLTVPLADAPSLDAALREDSLCWVLRDEGMVGFGALSEFSVRGPERFTQAHHWWATLTADAVIEDRVNLHGTGPIAFGSFTFSKVSEHDSRLIVPRLVLGLREGSAWLTMNSFQDDLSEERAKAELTEQLATPTSEQTHALADFELTTGSLSEAEWMAVVAAGVAAINAPTAGSRAVQKLVLARDIVARSAEPISRAKVLGQLISRYRECWTYGVGNFVGATPEMLVEIQSGVARARVLAGTVDRAGAPEDQDYPRRMLMNSEKQREEHEFAVKSLVRELAPFAADLSVPREPFVLELPNVWHLASDVSAELASSGDHLPGTLALLEALHPTAAVCGTPRLEAGALIRELEHLERGPYAGPVGWLDAHGNGEWGIGLRGAVLETAHTARLYAGCGIVGASDPASELAETWAKFRPMLQALGVQA